MSLQPSYVDSSSESASHSKSRAFMSPPPLEATTASPGGPVLPPHMRPRHTARQSGTQNLLQSSAKHHPSNDSTPPLTYDGFPSIESQGQPASDLEKQLRSMILSHETPSGYQRLPSSNTSRATALPQVQNPQPHGNRRRPNQAQRKHQAHQMQLPLQPPPEMPNVTPHQQMRSQHHGPIPTRGHFNTHQQRTINLPQHDGYQRWPPGAVVQQRTLLEPNQGAYTRRSGGHQPTIQLANMQAQIDYIDHIAKIKIPEVQMSDEERAEKQLLKDRLNDICCGVVCEHELQSNAEFATASVELKSFGSLSIGFATKDSDMDLVLVSPESSPSLSAPESEIPAKVEAALMDLGYGARLLTKTRVPIIKFCEKPGPELAAHLRLTRLWWEKERDLGLPQDESDLPESATEATEDLEVTTEKQDQELDPNEPTSDPQSSSEVKDLPAEKPEGAPPVNLKRSTRPSRAGMKFDPTWLSRFSDQESIGLLQTIVKECRGSPEQRTAITDGLAGIDKVADTERSTMLDDLLLDVLKIIIQIPRSSREALEFPKNGVGTQCDINFSNQLALHNSLLLKCYSLCDPRVRQMVLFVKAWTKIRKINSPYHGTMNSYGYVLMVLHFLMNVAQPPVLPNLQLAIDMIENDPLSSRETALDGHNIRFFRNEAAIEEMARNGVFGHNKESLGSLLRGFFLFYANPPFGAFSWKDDVLSLRTKGGKLSKVGKGWTGAKIELVDMAGPGSDQKKVNHRYVVAIEDPFETGHNVARTVVFNGVVAIRDEFRRAADLIAHAGNDPRLGRQDFFAEGKKKEHLQRRNDAPHRNAAPKKNASATSASMRASTQTKNTAGNQEASTKMDAPMPVKAVAAPSEHVKELPTKA